ncbi:MAG: thiolase family protein [Verrucomicrobiota bacterium]
MNKEVVFIAGTRTPFIKMGTDFADVDASDLGRAAVQALIAKTGITPDVIDETIFGCVSQPADKANIARVIALNSGIPESKPAFTVHRNCASGLEAITTAADRIITGRGDVYVVGGTESMSRMPLLYKHTTAVKFATLARSRSFNQKLRSMFRFRPKDFAPQIALRQGLTDPFTGLNMGQTAEILARDYSISRTEQDEFALRSHQLATRNRESINEEISTFYTSTGNVIDTDNGVRESQSLDALKTLKPVFEKHTGTVTAGNASQLTDGAVALLMMSRNKANELGLTPIGKLIDYQYAGCDPKRMGLGPAHAISSLKTRSLLTPSKADIIEINEAFAAQVIACMRKLQEDGMGIDPEKVNVNGGAIALGHPVGASGARLALTALNELKRRDAKTALISLCIGGGQGGAAWIERTD